jgi:hypothetical protein
LVITQRACQFHPYISALQLGQGVSVENLDPVMHNVHFDPGPGGNPALNRAQMPKRRPIEVTFTEAEDFIRLKCDVHPWQFAYISVIEHPFFAVTGLDGRFQIEGLPPGDYTVTATHRKAGTLTQQFKMNAHDSPQLEFTFVPGAEVANNP